LIKEFGTAQTALQVAFQGTTSLSEDAIKSQDALARQIAKVREEFALLLREISDSDSFKAYVRLALDLARALIEVTRALKPILPALATLGALGVARNAKAFAGGLSAGLAQPVRGFNTGGFIPGQGNRDTVPAMLTPGEFVVRKEAVQQVGLENLQRINRSGKFGKFNKGGIVGFQRGGAVPVGAGAGSGVDFTSIFLLTSVVGTLAQSFEGLGDTAKEFGKSLTSGIAQFFILRQLLTSIGPASQIRGELAQSQLSLRELRTERSKLQPQLIDSQQRLRDARSNVDIAGAQAAQAEKNELGKRVAANKAATIATNQEIRARQRSANVIAAGTAAVTSLIVATNLASQFLRRNASAELQNIRSGIGGNRNRFVSQSAAAGGFSGFSAGATAGLGIGAAAGTIVPGLGNVAGAGLGVVIGGTIGALNQYQSALKQARIELEKIDLSNEFNEFSRIIQKFNQGELSLNSSIGRINKQITDFGNQLETVSNAELREDLQGRISQARPALQTFVDTLARSSSSLEDFNNRLGEDRLNTLTTVLGISFSELQKSIRETIDASNNRLRIDRQSIQAQEQLRNRLVLQLEFASSVRDAATAAATFDSQLQSLSSSLSGSPVLSDFTFRALDQLSRIGELSNLDQFARDVGRIGDVFGSAGQQFANETIGAAKALDELPNILIRLRSSNQFGSNLGFVDRLGQELEKLGQVPEFVIRSIQSQADKIIGDEAKDPTILARLRSDFVGTVRELSAGLNEFAGPLRESGQAFAQEFNAYIQGLNKRIEIERKLISLQERVSNVRISRELAEARNTGRRVNPSELNRVDRRLQQAILGIDANAINNPAEIASRLADAQAKLITIQEQMSNSTALSAEELAKLAKSASDQQNRVSRLTRGLDFLANATDRARGLQEALNQEQRDRTIRFDLAKELAFSSREERANLNRTLQLSAVAARSGDINLVPEALRQDVLRLLERIGDSRAFGALGGLTGNEAIRRIVGRDLVRREGFSRGEARAVTSGTQREQRLIAEISRVNDIAENAILGLIENTRDVQQEFVNGLGQKFDKFISDLNRNQIDARNRVIDAQTADLRGRREGLFGQQTAAATIQDIISPAGGQLRDVVSLFESFNSVREEADKLTALLASVDASSDIRRILGLQDRRGGFAGRSRGAVPRRVRDDVFISREEIDRQLGVIEEQLSAVFGQGRARDFINQFRSTRLNQAIDSDTQTFNVDTFGRELSLSLEQLVNSLRADQSQTNSDLQRIIRDIGGQDVANALIANQQVVADALDQLPENFNSRAIEIELQDIKRELQQLNAGRLEQPRIRPIGGNTPPRRGNVSPQNFVVPNEREEIARGFAEILGRGPQRPTSGFGNSTGFSNLNRTNPPAASPRGAAGRPAGSGRTSPSTSTSVGPITPNPEQLSRVFAQFTEVGNRLAQSMDNFPREISLTGNHKVEVVFNGAEVFNNIQPELRNMVDVAVKDAFKRFNPDEARGLE
jgi:phage anti-repressor protein/predicted  nucleic acid-binding Zn-ribbon protein